MTCETAVPHEATAGVTFGSPRRPRKGRRAQRSRPTAKLARFRLRGRRSARDAADPAPESLGYGRGRTMTREIVAHHDPRVLAAPDVGWALVVHRAVPVLSLVELLERAAQPGPVSRALEHARGCAHCSIGQLCETGQR